MDKRRNDKKGEKALILYQEGFSLAEIAEKLGGTRQSIYDLLVRRDGYEPRKKVPAESQFFNGRKYTRRNNGYFLATTEPRTLIHRDKWVMENGEIPDNFDVHHKDGDKSNNDINNLVILSKQEHALLHSKGE